MDEPVTSDAADSSGPSRAGAPGERGRADDSSDLGPTFFIDRSLGGTIVRDALAAAGASVETHDEHFANDAPDALWLTEAGRRGWIVLTKDRRIRKRVLERRALRDAAVHAFFLGNGCSTGDEMARAYVLGLPAMARAITRASRPIWMTVHRDGRLTELPQDDDHPAVATSGVDD